MKKIGNVTAAYIAGIIDCKGYFKYRFGYLNKEDDHEGAETYIRVSSTCKPILDYLESTLGAGSTNPYPPENPKHKISWKWKIGPQDTFALLHRIAPYLQIKRERTYLLLKNEDLITKKGPRTESEKKILRRLGEKMAALTRRGV